MDPILTILLFVLLGLNVVWLLFASVQIRRGVELLRHRDELARHQAALERAHEERLQSEKLGAIGQMQTTLLTVLRDMSPRSHSAAGVPADEPT